MKGGSDCQATGSCDPQTNSAFNSVRHFNGDGTRGDLLPGTTVNAFNRGRDALIWNASSRSSNQTYAGTKDSPAYRHPASDASGTLLVWRQFRSLDIRLSRSFVIRDH
jgi:hypothetical protein